MFSYSKKSLPKASLFFTLFFVVFLSSCSKKELETTSLQPDETFSIERLLEGTSVENGILSIPSQDQFTRLLSYVSNMKIEDLKDFSSDLGFSAMAVAYDDFFEYSVSSTESGFDKPIKELRELYKSVLILEDDGMFRLNCTNPVFAKLANEDGLLIVEGRLFKFLSDRYIIIEDGDINKLSLGLRMQESSPEDGIFIVKKSQYIDATREQCSFLNYSFFVSGTANETEIFDNSWCWAASGSSNCKYKLQVEVGNIQYSTYEYMYAYAKGFKRGAFGIWYGYKSTKSLSSVNATISGPNPSSSSTYTETNTSYSDSEYSKELLVTIFDSIDDIPSAIADPATLSGGVGYNNGCVDFYVTFYSALPTKTVRIW